GSLAKSPCRAGREDADSLKDGSVLQYTSAANQLGQAAEIRCPQFRTHFQDGLCFSSEVKGLPPFVVVDAIYPVAVIEEQGCSSTAVYQQSVESPVQDPGEIRILLSNVHEVVRTV